MKSHINGRELSAHLEVHKRCKGVFVSEDGRVLEDGRLEPEGKIISWSCDSSLLDMPTVHVCARVQSSGLAYESLRLGVPLSGGVVQRGVPADQQAEQSQRLESDIFPSRAVVKREFWRVRTDPSMSLT